ncbi:LCP family protein [Paraoerskovia marina]|uniref:LCP family protein n=1 Tax=Paraoerskovia marina TaxID=545619 RepID=UPI00069419E2|nr:LCP family protein [Paraoerskovia marina]
MRDDEDPTRSDDESHLSLMDPPARALPARHTPGTARRHAGRVVGLVLTGVLTFIMVGAGAAYVDLRSQMDVHDVDDLLGADRPTMPTGVQKQPEDPAEPLVDPYADQALNIVVMGTDLRDGDNADVAGAATELEGAGMRSDSTMLVHVAGDRSRVEVVSIPRDSLVTIPECTRSDGTTTGVHYNTMFNTAFQLGAGDTDDIAGAAACTRRTIEQLTGVLTTDHVVVQMAGVTPIVDAIGGVRMCLPEEMHGYQVDLDLPAGEQVIDGETAINFLRARKGTGFGLEMGSDLARIERQQAFVDAAVHEVSQKNLLTDSPALYRLVEAVLKSISTSPGLGSPEALAGFAASLAKIPPEQVVFTSLPVVEAPTDRNRVVWTAEADAIWERLAADEAPPTPEAEITETVGESDATTEAPAGSSATPSDSSAETGEEDVAEEAVEETAAPGVCPS